MGVRTRNDVGTKFPVTRSVALYTVVLSFVCGRLFLLVHCCSASSFAFATSLDKNVKKKELPYFLSPIEIQRAAGDCASSIALLDFFFSEAKTTVVRALRFRKKKPVSTLFGNSSVFFIVVLLSKFYQQWTNCRISSLSSNLNGALCRHHGTR